MNFATLKITFCLKGLKNLTELKLYAHILSEVFILIKAWDRLDKPLRMDAYLFPHLLNDLVNLVR